jgi:quercetin dioxygenase-like cupin family protein
MGAQTEVRFYRVEDVHRERVTDKLDRRLISGERSMLAHVYLQKGCIVPFHSHDNEQISYILSGALRFWLGEEGDQEVVLRAGEVLVIPSHVRHKAEALEDTVDVDIFTPPRRDWLDGSDEYLRSGVDDLFRG